MCNQPLGNVTPQRSCSQILVFPALTWRWKLSSRRALSSMVALVRRSPAKEPGRFSSSWMRWAMRAWSLQRRDFGTSSAQSQPSSHWEEHGSRARALGSRFQNPGMIFGDPHGNKDTAWPGKGRGAGKGQEESPRKMFSSSSLWILERGKMGCRQLEMGETLRVSKENMLPLTPLNLWTHWEARKEDGGKLGLEVALGIPRNVSSCSSRGVTGRRNMGRGHLGLWGTPGIPRKSRWGYTCTRAPAGSQQDRGRGVSGWG